MLSGSFVENQLGTLIKAKIKNTEKSDAPFEGAGVPATFSQRIFISYAFGFIGKDDRDDPELIRRIRNHFAHHPLDTSFRTKEIQQRVEKLSNFKHDAAQYPPEPAHRLSYFLACALVNAFINMCIIHPEERITRQE